MKHFRLIATSVWYCLLSFALAFVAAIITRRFTPVFKNPYADVAIHLSQVAVIMAYLRRLMKVIPSPFGMQEFEDESILVAVTALLVDWDRIKRLVDKITPFPVLPST